MGRRLLGRFELCEAIERSIDDLGLLDLWFGDAHCDANVASDDGARTIAWLSPSGEIAGVLVQDYVNGESRIVPFGFGTIEIVNDGTQVSVYLQERVADPRQPWHRRSMTAFDLVDRRGKLADHPFEVQTTRDTVLVRFRGRLVRTLTGADADEVRAAVVVGDDAAVQLLVARNTGNFKRGNER